MEIERPLETDVLGHSKNLAVCDDEQFDNDLASKVKMLMGKMPVGVGMIQYIGLRLRDEKYCNGRYKDEVFNMQWYSRWTKKTGIQANIKNDDEGIFRIT